MLLQGFVQGQRAWFGLLAAAAIGLVASAQVYTAPLDPKTMPMEKPGSADCPEVQPSNFPQPRNMDNDGFVPTPTAETCGSSELVDAYYGIYLPPIEPSVPFVPAIGPDVMAGITYNSGEDSHCSTSTPTSFSGCSSDAAWLGPKFWLNARPQMVVWTPSGESLRRITIYASSRARYTFCETASGSDLYYGVNGNTGVIDVVTSGSASHKSYRFHQRNGDILWFFGPDEVNVTVWNAGTSSNVSAHTELNGQLWKITHDNGKSASDQPKMYVSGSSASDPSPDDAYTGFQLCLSGSQYHILPRVKTMFGSGGRKYEYAYSSDVLSTITVSDAASSTTLSTTTFHYYNTSSHGSDGTLKAIEVAEVVRPGSSSLAQTRIQYFRHGTLSMTGSPQVMKLTLAPEGVRRYCVDNAVTYPSSAPSASVTPTSSVVGVLVTSSVFNRDGTVDYTVDPMGIKSRTLYDKAGRTKANIANYVDGTTSGSTLADKHLATDDVYTRYKYENGLLRYMWVDVAGNDTSDSPPTTFSGNDADDQVTEYIYGTTKGTPGSGTPPASAIAAGNLLREVKYPDGSDSSHLSVHYAYDALGEQVWTRDQNQTVIATTYDKAGRQTARTATLASGSPLDDSVARIELAYTNRGQVSTVTQYDPTNAVYNQVAYSYDEWGNTAQMDQDPDSVVGSSGMAAFSVQFGYEKAAPTGGRTSVRRKSITYPGGWALNFKYTSIDDSAGRVTDITYTDPGHAETATRVQYQYLGAGQLVSTDYGEAAWASRMHDGATTPAYDHLDPFGRLVQNDWVRSNNSPTPVYDIRLSYDANSNITRVEDKVLRDLSDDLAYSTDYSMDSLNRVAQANRGKLVSGSITGTDRWNELWQLTHTGNWVTNKIDLDGDNAYTSSGELNESRSHNKINEITAKGSNTAIAYDAAGQLVDDGTFYQYRYDAFGRMVKVYQRNATRYAGTLISHYRYDGLGQRVGWRSNSTGITSSDPWFHFVYDDRWRIIETFRGNSGHTARDTNPKERFVMHNAGADGLGGSSYIDTVAWMDRDLSVDWRSGAGDNDLETRHYYCQNWRADTVVLLGKMTLGTTPEWLPQRHYRYSAYGRRVEVAPDDFNQDGFVDWFDLDDLENIYNTQTRSDLTFDGVLDASYYGYDDEALYGMIAGGTNTDGLAGGGVRLLWGGYQVDLLLGNTEPQRDLYCVRQRHLFSELGYWASRDPASYIDGPNLYLYASDEPLIRLDPSGLQGGKVPGTGGWDDPLIAPLLGTPGVKSITKQIAETKCLPPLISFNTMAPPCKRNPTGLVYDCTSHTIFVCNASALSAATLRHELIHTLDFCSGALRCDALLGNFDCDELACSEIRAYVYANGDGCNRTEAAFDPSAVLDRLAKYTIPEFVKPGATSPRYTYLPNECAERLFKRRTEMRDNKQLVLGCLGTRYPPTLGDLFGPVPVRPAVFDRSRPAISTPVYPPYVPYLFPILR